MNTGMVTGAGGAAAATSAAREKASMGKDQFLSLLLAQIKNQDPLSPMDNTEFTAQMAQFSSLEQLFNVNDNLQGLQTLSASLNSTQALNLIGKEVEFTGDNVNVGVDGIATPITFTLPDTAATVNIAIIDENGNQVRTIEAGSLSAGSQQVDWNGRDDNGRPVKPGLYKYGISAVDQNGSLLDVATYTKGIVTAVSMKNGYTQLHVGNDTFLMSEIKSVMLPNGNGSASATVN